MYRYVAPAKHVCKLIKREAKRGLGAKAPPPPEPPEGVGIWELRTPKGAKVRLLSGWMYIRGLSE